MRETVMSRTGDEVHVDDFSAVCAETNDRLPGQVTGQLIHASDEAFGGTGIVLAVDLGAGIWEYVREDEREMYPGARRVYVMRD